MLTSHALLAPHLPTLLLDQHRRHRTEMLVALEQAAERFAAEAAAVAVVLSARWEAPGPFLVDVARRHATITDYPGFGIEVRYDCEGSPALARALVEAGRKRGVRVGPAERGVDSGVTIPMHFLAPQHGLSIVPLSVAPRAPAECRAWGAVLRAALEARPERIALVVGGLLSCNEHAWMLRRDVPESRDFDQRVLGLLGRGAWDGLAALDQALAEKAQPAAGLRHLEVLRGFLDDEIAGTLRCYEAGPGVGAALMEFPVHAPAERMEDA